MARKLYVIDSKKIDRFIKEGRGQGVGKDYRPWLTVQDVPSNGRVHRPYSFKTERIHHLLSDIEYRHFLILDWSEKVSDVREQFPLDLDKTKAIAKDMGVRHPRDSRSDEFNVMTSDFLVVCGEGCRRRLVALAVKPAAELSKQRVIQKLEIERRYWEAVGGVEWYISTERQISRALVESLEWMRDAWDLSDIEEPHVGFLPDAVHRVVERISSQQRRDEALNAVCADLDENSRCPEGTHLMVARHLLARRVLNTDLDRRGVWKSSILDIEVDAKRFAQVVDLHHGKDRARPKAA